jgi:AAA+ ATPase superfamily predicted ATPase
MALPFLDRQEELARLRRAFAVTTGTFACVYGRRRTGKSRLLLEALGAQAAGGYYCSDLREAAIQRRALAAVIAVLLPGFDRVQYPDWEALLARWRADAPPGTVLALDEFPFLVATSPELPGLLQKNLDGGGAKPVHLVVCGSSQRMMHGLVLAADAPLYGRAREILRLRPLGAAWLGEALGLTSARQILDAYALWGGIPRYWELAQPFADTWEAMRALVLDPLGVLYQEPERLLADDLRDSVQANSLLSLVGQGCQRVSELAARLGKPATALSRPLRVLVDLGLIARETPWGVAERDSKRSLYRIADPFLGFWYRFVEPNRSVLEARRLEPVCEAVRLGWGQHVGGIWECLCREAVTGNDVAGLAWGKPSRWWGPGLDRKALEFDVVATSLDSTALLVGEVKLAIRGQEQAIATKLLAKIRQFPGAAGRRLLPVIFHADDLVAPVNGVALIGAEAVLARLR